MAKLIQAIRGMNDTLPAQTPYWRYLEDVLRRLAASYGYQEIRFPALEQTALFKRTIGEVTDIVEKEMYSFEDRNGDSLTLRPEGTAGCVRAGIENGLFYNQIQRLWYFGAMFRHERPQQGRYRQFHQFGVEATGMPGPDIDAELIVMTAKLWQQLGIEDHVTLELNSLGDVATRKRHREHLLEYFNQHHENLDADSKRRLGTNPLRILDSKNPDMQELIAKAPSLLDYLDDTSKAHFTKLCQLLDAAKVKYTINSHLVRGLDYYTHTVFEWVTDQLGSQGTICAGGRYDGLIAQLGGRATPAAGYALGLERLVALLETKLCVVDQPQVYMVLVGETAELQGLVLAEQLRTYFPQLNLLMNCGGGSFKSQFKRADKSGAQLALLLAEDEVQTNNITIKFLREDKPQHTIAQAELINFIGNYSALE